MTENKERWHVGKEIPLAIIFAIIMQTTAVVWWASNMDSRVETLERWVEGNTGVTERLSIIEEGQRWMRDMLQDIKRAVERERNSNGN